MSVVAFKNICKTYEYLSVWCIRLYVIIMSLTRFRVNPQSIVCLNVKELLARSRHQIWSLSDSQMIRTHNHLVLNRTFNHLAKLAKWLRCCWVLICMVNLTVCYHVTYKIQSESSLLFAWMARISLLKGGSISEV